MPTPAEELYLGYAINEDDILEIAENGKIISRIHKKGDGPSSYGNWNPVGLAFGPNKMRIVELPFRVLIYDQKYNVQHDLNVMSPLPIRASIPLGKTPWYQLKDTTFLLVGPGNYLSASYLIHDQLGKDTLQNFTQINLSTGTAKSVVPYSSSSIYKQSDGVYSGVMGKSYDKESFNIHLRNSGLEFTFFDAKLDGNTAALANGQPIIESLGET